MSSKIIGSDSNFYAEMVVDAMQSVKVTNLYGDSKYPVKSVNIVKSHGGKSSDSLLIKGYVL